jgi:hypothetical protein
MSIKLIGNETLTVNKQVAAGNNINTKVVLKHNYPTGTEQGAMVVSNDFDGGLDYQNIPLSEGEIEVIYDAVNSTSQNVKVIVTGGDIDIVYASKLFDFDSDLKINIEALVMGGNNILVKFVKSESREVVITNYDPYTVEIRYIDGDGYSDIKTLLDGNDKIKFNNAKTISKLDHAPSSEIVRYNNIIELDATHYLLSYSSANDAIIKLFKIDVNGNSLEIDTLTHGVSYNNHSMCKLDDHHIALAYLESGSDGHIKIFSVDAGYNSITEVSRLEHDTSYGGYNSLIKYDENHLALAYSGYSNDGYIKIFYVNSSYIVSQVSSSEHDPSYASSNQLVKIDSNHLMLAYADLGGYLYIKIFSIGGSYNITQITDTGRLFQYNNIGSLIKISDSIFATSGQFNVESLLITIINYDESYNVSILDVVQVDSTLIRESSMIMFANYAIVAYTSDFFGKLMVLDINYNLLGKISDKNEMLTDEYIPELEIKNLELGGEKILGGETIFPIIAAYSLPLESKMSVKRRLLSSVTVNKQIKSKAIPKILKSELVE